MPLITAVSGPYSSTFDPTGGTAAATLGIMEDGYEIDVQQLEQMINRSDSYADTPLDTIYTGLAVKVRGKALEYGKANLHTILFSQHATEFTATGNNSMKLGQPGRLGSAMWGTLVLTATAGTPAATSPATLTATGNTKLSPNFNVKFLLGPRHRTIPWEFQLYPYDNSGTNVFFVTT